VTQESSLPKTLILGVLLGAALVIAVASLAEPSQIYSFTKSNSWFVTVHTTINSYHTWRIDPLTSILSLAFVKLGPQMDPAFRVLPSIQLLIFYCGSVLLLLSQRRTFIADSFTAWLVPTLLSISTILLFGLDVVVFGALQWIPWLTVALGALQSTALFRDLVARLPIVIAVGFFTFLAVHGANQFAVITLLPALFFHRLVTSERFQEIKQDNSNAPFLIVKGLLVCIALYVSFSVPLAQFPSYPTDVLLVPDDTVQGIVRPNIGNDYPLIVLHRAATREILFPFASTILFSVIIAGGYVKVIGAGAQTGLFKLVLFLGTILLLDSLLPEKATLQLPLGALQRVLPALSYMPLHLLALALVTYLSYLCISSIRRIAAPCALFLALLITKAAAFGGSVQALYTPPYSSEASKLARKAAYSLDPTKREYFTSPSLFVMQYFNYLFIPNGVVDTSNTIPRTSLSSLPLKGAVLKVETTPPSSSIQSENMFDGDVATRWSPGGGVQSGGESIILYFSTPLSFEGLQVNTGNFKTDFPRGIRISIPEKCTNNLSTTGIWTFPEWQGSLQFSVDNAPYFGSQSDVVIPFGATVVTSCLIIEQIGSDSHYDWSVAEIVRLVKQ